MKYKNIKRVIQYLPQRMWTSLQQLSVEYPSKDIVFIPVPLHRRRRKERGFNQAELIALAIAKQVEHTLDSEVIIRIRYTIPQATLGREGRLSNLHGAFQLKKKPIPGTCYLLIDDVSSTRATLEECAKVLREGGATMVGAYVLARH